MITALRMNKSARLSGGQQYQQCEELAAHALASRLPALLVEASRVAHTVAHGVHGRRRAGPGETFWQFRHFELSDAASLIDWRRSASSDHYYIRQREWEAAHTVWLWPDLSPSMNFKSHLVEQTKLERALILAFAIGELLVQGGERAGLPGLMPPTASRGAVRRMALALARQRQAAAAADSLPPRVSLNRFSECLLFSDFLEPFESLRDSLEHYASQGVRGHLVQILDPAEETLPYRGRIEFLASEGGSQVLASRAEDLRGEYQRRLTAHREALIALTRRLQWSFLLHHTGRPASEALLALHTHLAGLASDYRAKPRRGGNRGTAAAGTAPQ